MNIIFEKIRYSNLMSIGATPIEIDLNTHLKTLVVGGNGTAKSTIIEAITFALYGKPYRDIKRNQLINAVNKAKMLVELWVKVGEKQVHIKRGIKPNIFEFYVNDELVEVSHSVREYQKELEYIVKLDEIVFKQMMVLSTTEFKPFMTHTAAERRNACETTMGLTIIGEMDRANKEQIRELNQNIKLTEIKIDHLEQQISTNVSFVKKQEQEKSTNTGPIIEEISEITSELRTTKDEYDKLNDEMDSKESEVSENRDAIQKSEELTQAINNYIVEYSTKKRQAENLLKLHDKGGNCELCGQDLSGISIDLVNSSLAEVTETIEKLKLKKAETDEHKRKLLSDKAQFDAIKFQLVSLNTALSQGVAKINSLKTTLDRLSKLDTSDHYAEKIKELKTELNVILKEKTKQISEKFTRGIISEIFKEDGIKSVIISKYIPFFNNRIKYYLDIMEADYEFTIDETFTETIKSRGRETFSYNSFSQGEKTRIDIAILFTWRDVSQQVSGSKISMLLMDEVFDSALDHTGIEAIHQIIDNMAEVYTFVISHRDQDVNMYDRVIKTQKKGVFSTIEVEDLSESRILPTSEV